VAKPEETVNGRTPSKLTIEKVKVKAKRGKEKKKSSHNY